MKTKTIIGKSGVALLLFMTTGIFTNAIAQKYEFKATTEDTSSIGGEYSGESNEIFIVDIDNMTVFNEESTVKISNLSDFYNSVYKFHQYDFDYNGPEVKMSLIIYDDENEEDAIFTMSDYHMSKYLGKAKKL